jgi:hypothetical protein
LFETSFLVLAMQLKAVVHDAFQQFVKQSAFVIATSS